MTKQDSSPFCSEYLSAGLAHGDDSGNDPTEVHLMLKTKDGGHFVLRCSTTAASRLWEGLSMLLHEGDF